MKLYHFSNADLDIIKVDNFGEHSYTCASVRVSAVKRTFFYLEPEPVEKIFFKNARFRYTVDVPDDKLYDCRADENGYFKQFDVNTDEFYQYLAKKYLGIVYYTATGWQCACLFHDIVPAEKIERGNVHA